MKLKAVCAALSLVAFAGTLPLVHAQSAPGGQPDKAQKGTNTAKAGGATSASASAVEALAAATSLVRYGDAAKDPLALIAAAKIMREVGSSQGTVQRVDGQSGDAKNKPDSTSVDAILTRAKGMAQGRPDLIALADDVAKASSRGATAGPRTHRDTVRSRATDSYRITFRGGEPARVMVSGDGDSDLDLFVYDENGNLVCKDDDGTDQMICAWNPRWTGPFTIRIRNLGIVNEYVLRHN
jgi:hypothetical protein